MASIVLSCYDLVSNLGTPLHFAPKCDHLGDLISQIPPNSGTGVFLVLRPSASTQAFKESVRPTFGGVGWTLVQVSLGLRRGG